ncbi:unnamed protein product, partial [Closterium sp. NIES-53]
DHFLTLDPTSLTVDLLEQHLLAAETSAVAVGAARGTSRSPFFEGCSPSPLFSSFACAAAADVSVSEDVGAASTSTKRRNSKGKGGRGSGGGSGGGGGGSGSGSGGSGGTGDGGGGSGGGSGGSGGSGGRRGGGTSGGRSGPQRGGPGGGRGQQQQRPSETQTPQQLREWLVQRGPGEGSETCPYVIRTSAREGRTCGRFHTERHCFARLDNAWRTEFGDDVERPRWAELLSAEDDCYRCVPPDPGIAAAALGASASNTPPGTAPAEALHTFTLDFGASCCFFHDSTTLTPLPAPVPVRLADPSGGPVVARSSTVLPCPAVPSGSLSGLHLPSFSTNLVSTTALQDAMVTTTTPGGSSLYTLATELPQVAVSAQVSASGQVATSCSCRLLSHQTLLWHHRLGHPSLPRLCGMHSRLLGRKSYFLLVVEDYTRYTTVFPLRSKGEGILQSFTLPDSPQQNGIVECHIGLVMEVARTSMIHAAAPHFLWPFAIRYAAHQLNLWPRVSLPETSPTLRWTGKVGDASVFRVWGSRAFVRDTSADKLSARAIPYIFLGFVPDALGSLLPSLPLPLCPSPPPPLFLAPGPPPVDPLLPQGPAPSGVSQVDPLLGTATVQGVEPVGAKSEGAEPGGAESEGAESGGAEPRGAASFGGPVGASPRLSSQQLREWLVQRPHCRSGAPGAGEPGDAGAGGAAITTGAGDPTEPGAAGARGAGAGVVGVGGPGAGGAGAAGAGAVDPGAGGAGGTVRPRPYFVPLH